MYRYTVWLTGLLAAGLMSSGCNGDDNNNGLPGGAARFFLPTGAEVRNTTNPSMEIDPAGNLHMVYPAYAKGDAFYAVCGKGCKSLSDVRVVTLKTTGTANNVMLALGPDHKPQVLIGAANRVYYATCSGDCGKATAWTVSMIHDHFGEREISGEAFAVSPDGRPAFVMHTYRTAAGIGQGPAATWYASCDGGDCHDPASWNVSQIANQIWQENTLRFNAAGQARLATVATIHGANGREDVGAYLECNQFDCTTEAVWEGVSLANAYVNRWVEEIDPAISMELTRQGYPRLLLLAKNALGKRNLTYMACDANCIDQSNWKGGVLLESDKIGAGLDLTLDAQDRPRFVYAPDWKIMLASCDSDCTGASADWKLTKVEFNTEMPADQIFPYWNCHVSGWRLRHPSIAIGSDGMARVSYRAEDISVAGTPAPDPTKPACKAGPDMTLTRYTLLGSLK